MAVKILSVDDELDLEVLLTQYFRRQIRKGEYEFAFAHNIKPFSLSHQLRSKGATKRYHPERY